MAAVDERLLLESEDVLLLESGDALLLELRQVIEAAGEHVGSLAQSGSHTASLTAVGGVQMAHLTSNSRHWYAASPVDMDITVSGASASELSDLVWVLDGVVELSGTSISTVDNSDGDAVVTVSIGASDATQVGVFDWQLRGDVNGSGPKVLAVGSLTLSELLSG